MLEGAADHAGYRRHGFQHHRTVAIATGEEHIGEEAHETSAMAKRSDQMARGGPVSHRHS
jgi:hypothetical protein